jgi:predicted ATPase
VTPFDMTQPNQVILGQLMRLFSLAKTGSGQFVLLQAPAGLGKSHLLHQFVQTLPVQQGHILPSQQSDTDVLSRLLHTLHPLLSNEHEPNFLEAARCFAPQLTWAMVAALPRLERKQMWSAIARAVHRLTVRLGGLVMVFEDIHDASNDNISTLRFLYRQWLDTQAPLLVLVSPRPELPQSIWEGICTDANPFRLELVLLDAAGVQHLSEAVAARKLARSWQSKKSSPTR